MEYRFGQLGSAVPALSPPNFCVLSLLANGAFWAAAKAWTLCECCLAITKTSLYCQHCFQHKPEHSPALATVKKIKSVSAKTSTLLLIKCNNFEGRIISVVKITVVHGG